MGTEISAVQDAWFRARAIVEYKAFHRKCQEEKRQRDEKRRQAMEQPEIKVFWEEVLKYQRDILFHHRSDEMDGLSEEFLKEPKTIQKAIRLRLSSSGYVESWLEWRDWLKVQPEDDEVERLWDEYFCFIKYLDHRGKLLVFDPKSLADPPLPIVVVLRS